MTNPESEIRREGARGETVTLWRLPRVRVGWTDWRAFADADEEYAASCTPGAESVTAVIVPEGSVGVVLTREELYEAMEELLHIEPIPGSLLDAATDKLSTALRSASEGGRG